METMESLKGRFAEFKEEFCDQKPEIFELLKQTQVPKYMVFACADSRVCPSHILKFQPGEAFMMRNVANLVPPYDPRQFYSLDATVLGRQHRMAHRFVVPRVIIVLLLLFCFHSLTLVSEAKMRVSIPDELSDVMDDEEDEAWKEWGRKKPTEDPRPPPYDPEKMSLLEFQAEMLKRHVGPTFGFVKLRLGLRRTPDDVTEITSRWSKILRTGSVEVTFMIVDTTTIMFNLQKGQKIIELKEFLLDQPEAYEVKIGDQLFRRPGDPPLDEVVERLHRKGNEASKPDSSQEPDPPRDEL